MASVLLQATAEYIQDHPRTKLNRIDVVIFLPGMVREFIASMQQSVEQKSTLWQWFKVTISAFMSNFASGPTTKGHQGQLFCDKSLLWTRLC